MLKFTNDKIEPSEFLLSIPCFNEAFKKDKTKQKENFNLLLTYLFFVHDARSPYIEYPISKRKEIVNEKILLGHKMDYPDTIIKECEEVYKLKKSAEHYLLESAIGASYKIAEYLENIDLEDGEQSIKEIVDVLKNIGNVIASLKKLRQDIKNLSNESDRIVETEFLD